MFEAIAGALTVVFFLGLVGEKLNEYFVRPLLDAVEEGQRAKYLRYSGLAIGTAIGIAFQQDVITPIITGVGGTPIHPWAGIVLTAFLIGGHTPLLHDVFTGRTKKAIR